MASQEFDRVFKELLDVAVSDIDESLVPSRATANDRSAVLIVRLRALGRIAEAVETVVDESARAATMLGVSYANIGKAMKITRQRAHQRFRPKAKADPSLWWNGQNGFARADLVLWKENDRWYVLHTTGADHSLFMLKACDSRRQALDTANERLSSRVAEGGKHYWRELFPSSPQYWLTDQR